MKPKILVGCPTSDHKGYALERYVEGIKKLEYDNIDILIVDNSKGYEYIEKIKSLGLNAIKGPYHESARQRIIDSRNILRKKVLDEGYDYFFSLEQDVIPPKDVIERMLNHNKKIITGVYFSYQTNNGVRLLVPLLWKRIDENEVRFMLEKEVIEPKLIEVGACGVGCILIHKNVLKKVKFRFDEKSQCFDDMWFCHDSYKQGFKIFADTSLKCTHLIQGWDWENIKK